MGAPRRAAHPPIDADRHARRRLCARRRRGSRSGLGHRSARRRDDRDRAVGSGRTRDRGSRRCPLGEQVYTHAAPAVVQITSTLAGQNGSEPTGRALGSGFVIDKEGHIVTNFHVVEGAEKIESASRTGRPSTRPWSAGIPPRISLCSRSTCPRRPLRHSHSRTPTRSRSASRSSRSATRSGSSAPSRQASSAHSSAR